jgi:hypothetical protein
MTIFLYANWLTATALMAELVSWTNHSATGEIAQLVLVPNQSRENPGKAFGSFSRLNKAFFPADDARDNQKFRIGGTRKGKEKTPFQLRALIVVPRAFTPLNGCSL